jgi:hypothetical protein
MMNDTRVHVQLPFSQAQVGVLDAAYVMPAVVVVVVRAGGAGIVRFHESLRVLLCIDCAVLLVTPRGSSFHVQPGRSGVGWRHHTLSWTLQ